MNFSPEKLLLVGIIALLVLGPNRLPQAARTLGRLLTELRRLSATVQGEVASAIAEPHQALQQAVGEFGLGDVRSSLRATLDGAVKGTVVGGVVPPANHPAGSGPGAPIVDPSVPLEVPAPLVPPGRSAAQAAPPPDDPSLN